MFLNVNDFQGKRFFFFFFFRIFYCVWRNVKKPNHIFRPPQTNKTPLQIQQKLLNPLRATTNSKQITMTNARTNTQTAKNQAKPTTRSYRCHHCGVDPKQPPTIHGKPLPTKKPTTSSTNKSRERERERERERANPIGEAHHHNRKTTPVVTIASPSGSRICSAALVPSRSTKSREEVCAKEMRRGACARETKAGGVAVRER